jgi:hypothetical protein
MSITVEDDGDAVWAIEYRTRLETDEDEAAFLARGASTPQGSV